MRPLKHALAVLLLTLLTQVGGILYLLHIPIARKLRSLFPGWRGSLIGATSFIILLVAAAIWVIPTVARPIGRVPLPLRATTEVPLAPGGWLTVLANRHYVKPEMLDVLQGVAKRMAARFPGTELRYLDANFPFLEGYPLLPHRSHDDGNKVDISFLYLDEQGKRVNASPGLLGYGYVEAPGPGEQDQPAVCADRGYWQYSLLSTLNTDDTDLTFDEVGTAWLVRTITADPRIGKVFVEPHLKTRLGQGGNDKVRFHGCVAVRHDDHIHLQL
ncbi:hypothetical protein [Lewinella sp. IMCC34191]|uniref:hypothetical protein n=1 Tax=Lewinella sp. IMCC34191 TaxID=2259172 RepID=UPI000E275628|nr:hypothetical protein [Lewinella sp. IMCC34191]